MRKYKTETNQVTRKALDVLTCDLCSAIGKGEQWETSIWEVNTVDIAIMIHHNEGDIDREGGSGTKYTVDMCPKCFKEKLIPWLQSQGATVQPIEWLI
jgi:hypothetical protein